MRIGIIGTGGVAKDCYLPFLMTQPDVDLLYFNRTRAKADACAEKFGGTVCNSISDMVAAAPDSIFVLTKETVRGDILGELAPLKPRRLFLEKPLVARKGQDNVDEMDYSAARDVMRRLHDQGCETAMIFNYRFFDQVIKLREIIQIRSFGKPVSAVAMVNYACWSHCIDLMHYFVGPVETIASQTGGMQHKDYVPDITGAMRFENGASGTILGTWAMNFDFTLFELFFNFEGGRVHLRGLDGELEILDYSGKRQELLAITRNTSRWDQYRASFAKSIGAYLESLRRGDPPPIPGSAGLEELRFEAALRRSAATGAPVRLRDAFPL